MKKVLYLITALLLISAFSLTACGGGTSDQPQGSSGGSDQTQASSGDSATGQVKFTATCAPCHGPAGEGVTGLGKDMTTSEFIAGKSDAELVEFIKIGREITDPLNTTGVPMPAKGGNPALTDDDLQDIVSYIRTLQK